MPEFQASEVMLPAATNSTRVKFHILIGQAISMAARFLCCPAIRQHWQVAIRPRPAESQAKPYYGIQIQMHHNSKHKKP
jgi:hypothetical protein